MYQKTSITLFDELKAIGTNTLAYLFIAAMVLITNFSFAAPESGTKNLIDGTAAYAKATINKVWVEHNVRRNDRKGMLIHVSFNVNGMKGRSGDVVAYFYHKNGTALKDKNGRYDTADGKVAVGKDIRPNYRNTVYKDLTLFMPYGELHLNGKYQLKFNIGVFNGKSMITRSGWTNFNVTWNSKPKVGNLTCSIGGTRGDKTIAVFLRGSNNYSKSVRLNRRNRTYTFRNVPAGSYTVEVTNNSSGKSDCIDCSSSKRVYVRAGRTSSVSFPRF